MPYTIRRLKSGLYRVRLKDTKQILSYATTLEKAKKQIAFLGMRDKLKGGYICEHCINKLYDDNIYNDKNSEKTIK